MSEMLDIQHSNNGARRAIESLATVTPHWFLDSLLGPQWERPTVDFTFANGEVYTWYASDDVKVRFLSVGDTVQLRGFSKESGKIYRPTWKMSK